MSEIYCVEVPGAPDKANRFLTYFGNEYAGINSVQFVQLNRAIRKVNGVLQGDKPQSMCRKMVDDAHAHAANGGAAYLASARVLKYLGPDKYEIAYEGKEVEVKHVEPETPKAMLASDGTWRTPPVAGFQKGPREWALSIAFVDSSNTARADRINGKTKLETVTKLFESSLPWHQELVRSYPLAHPNDVPTPPAPKVEYVPSAAELAAVLPLDPRVWNAMSVEEHKRRWAFEPLYREAYRKMEALDKQRQQQEAERIARQREENELKKLREGFEKKDADEARKTGVGTIL